MRKAIHFSSEIQKFSLALHRSTPMPPQRGRRGGGADILKGVYYALVLTFWNRRKIQKTSQEQSNVNAPWVWSIHAPMMPYCHWCTLTPMANIGQRGFVI